MKFSGVQKSEEIYYKTFYSIGSVSIKLYVPYEVIFDHTLKFIMLWNEWRNFSQLLE